MTDHLDTKSIVMRACPICNPEGHETTVFKPWKIITWSHNIGHQREFLAITWSHTSRKTKVISAITSTGVFGWVTGAWEHIVGLF